MKVAKRKEGGGRGWQYFSMSNFDGRERGGEGGGIHRQMGHLLE